MLSTSCVAWRELKILFRGGPPFTGARLKFDMAVVTAAQVVIV